MYKPNKELKINLDECDKAFFIGCTHKKEDPKEDYEFHISKQNVLLPEIFTCLEECLVSLIAGAPRLVLGEFCDLMAVLTSRVCRRVAQQRMKDDEELDSELANIFQEKIRELNTEIDTKTEGREIQDARDNKDKQEPKD